MRKAQSAVEYLITYGWAILIIVLAVSLLYFYVLLPTLSTPNSCAFAMPISCQDIVLSTNTITNTANIIVLVTNSQQYPIQSPSLFASVNGINTSRAACSPGFVTAGGVMVCQLSFPSQAGINGFVSGKLYLNASNCGFAANYSSVLSCTSYVKQTYVGTFTAHAQSTPANTAVTISLTSSNNGGSVYTNLVVTLSATVKVSGSGIGGVVVNFTQSSNTPSLTPRYPTTGIGGVAQSSLKEPRSAHGHSDRQRPRDVNHALYNLYSIAYHHGIHHYYSTTHPSHHAPSGGTDLFFIAYNPSNGYMYATNYGGTCGTCVTEEVISGTTVVANILMGATQSVQPTTPATATCMS